jgi:hypothetical protein
MQAKRLKESKNFQEGVYYQLDTPIEHDGQEFDVICTFSSRQHKTGILIFPASSGVLAIKRQDGKLVQCGTVLQMDKYTKSTDLVRELGYELS